MISAHLAGPPTTRLIQPSGNAGASLGEGAQSRNDGYGTPRRTTYRAYTIAPVYSKVPQRTAIPFSHGMAGRLRSYSLACDALERRCCAGLGLPTSIEGNRAQRCQPQNAWTRASREQYPKPRIEPLHPLALPQVGFMAKLRRAGP